MLTVYGSGLMTAQVPVDSEILRAFICSVRQGGCADQLMADDVRIETRRASSASMPQLTYVFEIKSETSPYLNILFNSRKFKVGLLQRSAAASKTNAPVHGVCLLTEQPTVSESAQSSLVLMPALAPDTQETAMRTNPVRAGPVCG